MDGLIVDHAWRPPPNTTPSRAGIPVLERPCEYMACGRPRREHAEASTGVATRAVVVAVDWSRYRSCDACKAGLGEPCLQLSGATADGEVAIPAARAHGVRQLRTGYARTGDDRG